jgi:PleD family two-component response regulator
MVGVPPLTHDRALSLRTKSTLPVDTLNDCALLYTFGNKTEQYCIPRDERPCFMTPTEPPVAHKVLLVDDDDAVRAMMNATLEHKGFEVVAAANVTEALRHISTESCARTEQ